MVVMDNNRVEYCRVINSGQSLINYFYKLGIRPGQQLLVHGAFKKLKNNYPGLTPDNVNEILTEMITIKGSVIYPAFTYCLKKTNGKSKTFDPATSPAATGVLAQSFWNREDVVRTLSPTHSFGLWGQVAGEETLLGSPDSPLGRGSVVEWLARQNDAHILLLGTDFRAFTLGHYLEVVANVPWVDVFPWNHLDVLPVGVSVYGEQPLIQVPGCSGGFINFQSYLEAQDLIKHEKLGETDSMFISVDSVLEHGRTFIREHNNQLLCSAVTCKACGYRRKRCEFI